MAKTTKRKGKAAIAPDDAQVVREQAKRRLQRAIRFERQIQALSRRLVREMRRSERKLVDLAREVMNRITEPDGDPTEAPASARRERTPLDDFIDDRARQNAATV